MSETMSSPTDWPQFYDQNLSNQEISNRVRVLTSESVFGDHGSDSNVVVNTSIGLVSRLGSGLGGSNGLSPEGRVGKPVRRRSRASRRTPTTLLNTDTTNFRAMVQQFTGGPTAPFATGGSHPGGPNLGFGLGTRHLHVNPSNSLMFPPTGFHSQYQSPLTHQQNQGLMFSLNNNDNNNPRTGTGTGTGTGEVLFQRFGGGGNMGIGSDVSSQVPVSRTSASSNENRSNPSRLMF